MLMINAMFVSRIMSKVWLLTAAVVLAGGTVVLYQATAQKPDLQHITATTASTPDDRPPPHLDRYGDPLPSGALLRLGTVRLRHANRIACVAFSPDGLILASGAMDGDPTIRLWDVITGHELRRIHVQPGLAEPGQNIIIMAVAYSPDGRTLASGGDGNNVSVWDVNSGKRIHTFAGHTKGVTSVAFAPDGRTLASGSYDHAIRLWNAATGNVLLTLSGHQGAILSVAFSPDGRMLATGSGDKTIRLWDVNSGKELRVIAGHAESVMSVTFHRSEKILASGSSDKTLRLWDVATGKEIRRLEGHKKGVSAVAFSADGKALASAGRDRTVRWWDWETGKQVRQFDETLDFSSLSLSPDGKRLAAGSFFNGIYLIDVATGKETPALDGSKSWICSLRYSPDGKTLAVGDAGGRVRLWDPHAGREFAKTEGGPAWVTDIAFSPDGRTFVSSGYEHTLSLRAADSAKVIRQFKGHQDEIYAVAFSPDGRRVASAAEDKTVRVWDVATGNEVNCYPGPEDQAGALAFSPDNNCLAVTGTNQDKVFYLLDLNKCAVRWRTTDLSHKAIVFSPDGQTILSVSGNAILVLDAATGKEIRGFEERDLSPWGGYCDISLSPSGRFVASGDHTGCLRIWEVATGKEAHRVENLQGGVHAVAIGADGKTVASGGLDSTVLLWHVAGPTTAANLIGQRLAPKLQEILWSNLASTDAIRAYQAIWTFVAASEQTVAFMRQHLQPIARTPQERIAKLVADLDSDEFAVRQTATDELKKLGEAAEPALRKSLQENVSVEVRRHVEDMLRKIDDSPIRLRQIRAIEVLEQIGSEEAVRFLRELAGGAAHARLTHEAQMTLKRLKSRSALAR